MRISLANTNLANKNITRRNNHSRFLSVEKQQFTKGAAAGCFLSRLPYEVGFKIGEHLDRNDAKSIVATCTDAKKMQKMNVMLT